MEFPRLPLLALFCIFVVGSNAWPSDEDYWRSIWPNTPMPKNLQDLLKPANEITVTKVEDTQYPSTFFLEKDIEAGRKLKLGFNKRSNAQPFGVFGWLKGKVVNSASDDAPTHVEDTQYPSTFIFENDLHPGKQIKFKFNKHSYAQPFGVFAWQKNINIDDTHESSEINVPAGQVQDTQQYPSTFFFENDLHPGKLMNLKFNKRSNAQPYGVYAWLKGKANGVSESDASAQVEDTQYPSTFFFENDLHKGKQMNLKFNKHSHAQPFGVFAWQKNEDNDATTGVVEDTQYPSTFFFEQDLEAGKEMKLQFNKHSHGQPFGVGSWAKNVDASSIETKKFTLEELCDKRPPAEGEDKICAKSLESLVDFVISKLGKDVQALSSSFVPHQNQYNILEGVQKVAEDGVMCHRLNFRNVVLYCHQVNATSAYTVPMAAPDGTETKALAVCHHDTRGINEHILFHQLKVKPGTVPVCHFLGTKALLWVPTHKPFQAI